MIQAGAKNELRAWFPLTEKLQQEARNRTAWLPARGAQAGRNKLGFKP